MADIIGVGGEWHPDSYYYGWDGEYHAPNQMYAPGTNVQGKRVIYRPDNELYGIEDGIWHNAGTIYCIDGKRHPITWFCGVDGQYHAPDVTYDVRTGRYSDYKPG